jgi:hypothetical protein
MHAVQFGDAARLARRRGGRPLRSRTGGAATRVEQAFATFGRVATVEADKDGPRPAKAQPNPLQGRDFLVGESRRLTRPATRSFNRRTDRAIRGGPSAVFAARRRQEQASAGVAVCTTSSPPRRASRDLRSGRAADVRLQTREETDERPSGDR